MKSIHRITYRKQLLCKYNYLLRKINAYIFIVMLQKYYLNYFSSKNCCIAWQNFTTLVFGVCRVGHISCCNKIHMTSLASSKASSHITGIRLFVGNILDFSNVPCMLSILCQILQRHFRYTKHFGCFIQSYIPR